METLTVLILMLLVAGVIGSIIPLMPGALLSLSAVVIYFFRADDPSILFTVFGVLTASFALIADWFAGSVAAKYGGASNKTSLMAGIAGIFGFFLLGGPLGLAVAVATVVFVREYLIHGKEEKGLKAAVYATIGVLGSAVIQTMLTASILLGFLLTMVI